ncbi:hypothetical protein [Longimicrobium terrae]|uniref:Uncharacterized protein n=1 Tax=Longimicrobium terrae TaxID=1639882 RepID=A0A841H7M4_9BACT|nr:hypothetical protein [Longimicrobium terrae]MBB4639609.1 hypothetical protein [Longimicrobium terrae]MBB6073988.1 hypothetical protein [Longimicrobium terrae]NNC28308.1 hypothetical protein [Longimicrobium terrae]
MSQPGINQDSATPAVPAPAPSARQPFVRPSVQHVGGLQTETLLSGEL